MFGDGWNIAQNAKQAGKRSHLCVHGNHRLDVSKIGGAARRSARPLFFRQIAEERFSLCSQFPMFDERVDRKRFEVFPSQPPRQTNDWP